MSSPFLRAAKLLTAVGSLGISASVGAQACRLDYQRADSPTATLGSTTTLGVEQIALSAGQQQGFITDWKYETARGSSAARYGSHVRSAVNRGTEAVSLALVGKSVNGFASAPGGDVVQVMGGLSGGVVNDRGTGNVAGTVATQGGSWILLQPGDRAENLQHDLAAVACGGTNTIVRAVSGVLLRAPAGAGLLSVRSGSGSR
jgi:hypothetical protein